MMAIRILLLTQRTMTIETLMLLLIIHETVQNLVPLLVAPKTIQTLMPLHLTLMTTERRVNGTPCRLPTQKAVHLIALTPHNLLHLASAKYKSSRVSPSHLNEQLNRSRAAWFALESRSRREVVPKPSHTFWAADLNRNYIQLSIKIKEGRH